MTNHNKREQQNLPMRTGQNSKQMHVTGAKRGKTRATKSRLVLVLHLIGWVGGARFLNQLQSVVKRSNSALLSTVSWENRSDKINLIT